MKICPTCGQPIHVSPTLSMMRDVIKDLNAVTGRSFRPRQSGFVFTSIRMLLAEGYDLDDFHAVHVVKWTEWKGTHLEHFCRPSTLYNPDKFSEYLEQAESEKQKTTSLVNSIKEEGYQ